MLHKNGKVQKLLLLLVLALLSSCATTNQFSRKEQKELDQMVRANPVFRNIHSGFALYDPETREWLYQLDAQKYYTPASNTKLFTLYAFLTVCGDQMPAIRFANAPEGRILQGTGNPLLLHPELPQDTNIWAGLLDTRRPLWYSTANFEDQRLGPGWSWSDFGYGYQAEVSPMPVYGNLIHVEADTNRTGFLVFPPYYRTSFRYEPDLDDRSGVRFEREEFANRFVYNRAAEGKSYFQRYIPIFDMINEAPVLLSDTLRRTVSDWPESRELPTTFRTVYSETPDTMLRLFMHSSDNFLAEQLLLCVSSELFDGRLNAGDAIDSVKTAYLSDLPDEPRWVDGSGLSRYNLFTPRSVVQLLEKMREDFGLERLLPLLPAGGVRGTIKSWYPGPDGEPYVFAKTGTLSNKHALSGYLRTRRGRVLIFSFMHNNYIGSSNQTKVEMQKVLEYVYANY